MIRFDEFKSNVLSFLDRCYPSSGVFDAEAWEESGENSITDEKSRQFIVPEEKRKVIAKTLQERMWDNDWAFSSTPGGCESLEGGHSAVETLHYFGELNKLSADNRKAWTDYFNSYQDKDTGYYLGPYVRPREHRSWKDERVNTHPWEHMHDHLISCLCPTMMLLGGKSRFRLSEGTMTGRFLEKQYLEEFLWDRDWNNYRFDLNFRRHNPWWMGNEFWYPACMLWQIVQWEEGTPAAKTARELIDTVWYKWHDENFGVSGFWYGDIQGKREKLWHGRLPEGSEIINPKTPEEYEWMSFQVMGGAHQLWLYDYDNHPISEDIRRKQTDMILLLQKKSDKLFGLTGPDDPHSHNNNCTDVDCMTLLANNYFRQDYRRDEIERALYDALKSILATKISSQGILESQIGIPFTHCFNSYETFSPAGWGNVLNQSFYTWAVVSACRVLKSSNFADLDRDVTTFIEYGWPRMPSHWLATPHAERYTAIP